MKVRHIKRRVMNSMSLTAQVKLRVPMGMTCWQAMRALQSLTRNSIRTFR